MQEMGLPGPREAAPWPQLLLVALQRSAGVLQHDVLLGQDRADNGLLRTGASPGDWQKIKVVAAIPQLKPGCMF